MKRLTEREAVLDEITTLMGQVLEAMEKDGRFRTHNVRNLRLFIDAFVEAYRRLS